MFSKPHTGELVFFWLLFGAVGILAFTVLSPYLAPLFLAFVLAILFLPIEHRFRSWLRGDRTLSALLGVVFVLFVVLIPLIVLGGFMFKEVREIGSILSRSDDFFLVFEQITTFLEGWIRNFVPGFEIQNSIDGYVQGVFDWIEANLTYFFAQILSYVLDLFLVLVAMFFLWRDGGKLRAFAMKWSPLEDRYDESILAKLELGVSSVVKGALTTAIVQGVLVGIGFAIFDVPNPVLWGVVASVAALIPLVGTAIVTMPAVAYLLFSGMTLSGIGLIVWAFLCVGLSDNVLNPLLMRRGMNVHPFIILLSVFGGLAYFGPIGFLAGPITMAFFFALLDVYPAIVKGRQPEPIPEPIPTKRPRQRKKLIEPPTGEAL